VREQEGAGDASEGRGVEGGRESRGGEGARRAALLERARAYPYGAPPGSFTYRAGRVEPFDPALTGGRTPVLAIGSNRSPRRLAEKLGAGPEACVPVERVRLADHDVVYSAHLAAYGAVPAMLHEAPGATVEVALTWLTPEQLERIHATELGAANYRYAWLEGIELQRDDGSRLAAAGVYLSCRGFLHAGDGVPIGLAAVRCRNRAHGAMDTAGALEVVRRRVAPTHDPDHFVLRAIEEPAFRRAVIRALAG